MGRSRVHVIVPCTCDPNLRAQMIVGAPGGVIYVSTCTCDLDLRAQVIACAENGLCVYM